MGWGWLRPCTPVGLRTGATLLDSIGDLGRCTHLVCAKLMRTAKFLCALCVAPHIVTVGWVADSCAPPPCGPGVARLPCIVRLRRGTWMVAVLRSIRQGRFIDPHKFALSGVQPLASIVNQRWCENIHEQQ